MAAAHLSSQEVDRGARANLKKKTKKKTRNINNDTLLFFVKNGHYLFPKLN